MLDLISQQLHELAIEKANKYLVAEAELLSVIIEIDRQRLFEKFDETHLTPYCIKYLKLDEHVAAMFVRVARKAHHVPELELAVREGLQISKAKTIASVIDQGNKEQWIEKAQTLTKERLEREVASVNPSAAKPEKAKPTGPNRVRIEFEVSFEEAELLKHARELMAKKNRRETKVSETFVFALKEWVDREDPVRRAERAEVRKEKRQQNKSNSSLQKAELMPGQKPNQKLIPKPALARKQVPAKKPKQAEQNHRPQDRSAISAEVLHRVNLRDRGLCRKRMPDGTNCGCAKWTEIHHIIPRAYGGKDTVENLITLCSAHHRQLHARSA